VDGKLVKEVVIDVFLEKPRKGMENLLGYPASGPRVDPGTSQIQRRNVIHLNSLRSCCGHSKFSIMVVQE
jgi:hypothetical protein